MMHSEVHAMMLGICQIKVSKTIATLIDCLGLLSKRSQEKNFKVSYSYRAKVLLSLRSDDI
jgi:hypothetical protein